MKHKWTAARHRKFQATLASKRANGTFKTHPNTGKSKMLQERLNDAARNLPVVEINGSHSEAEEFAQFMAAAWKIYKEGR